MRDTRYDVWGFGRRAGCQGAVQEIELVPKTEVGGMLKLNRGERPSTGQLGEALWFRCSFRRQFQSPATKVPFSEPGLRGSYFRFPASEVPFLEVVEWKGSTRAIGPAKYAAVPFPLTQMRLGAYLWMLLRRGSNEVRERGFRQPSAAGGRVQVRTVTEWTRYQERQPGSRGVAG